MTAVPGTNPPLYRSTGINCVVFSRACTASEDFITVSIIVREGQEQRQKLPPWKRRFIEENITPAEWTASQAGKTPWP